AADGVALEVPRDVLADVPAAAQLVAEELDEQFRVPAERLRDLAERRLDPRPVRRRIRPAGLPQAAERGREVAEQPRTAEAAAADDDPVAAGLAHHPQRVLRAPDVAVAEHR